MKENKLIADFMGMTPCLTGEGDFLIKGNPIEAKYLPYATSWDWLIPVVREILTTIELDNLDYDTGELRYNTLDCDIDGVYKEVVIFIKQQNDER